MKAAGCWLAGVVPSLWFTSSLPFISPLIRLDSPKLCGQLEWESLDSLHVCITEDIINLLSFCLTGKFKKPIHFFFPVDGQTFFM